MKKQYRILLFNLLLCFVITLVVAVQIITYVQTKHLLEANQDVLQTQQIIGALDKITIGTIEISATARDYILTGDKSRVKEFNKMEQLINQSIADLDRLIANNKTQKDRMALLLPMLQGRISYAQQIIDVANTKGKDIAETMLASGIWLDQTEQLKDIISEMFSEESMTLNVRNNIVSMDSDKTRNMIYVASGVMLCMLILIVVILNVQHAITSKIERKRDKLQSIITGITDGTSDSVMALDLDYKFIALNSTFVHEFKKLYGKQPIIGESIKETLAHLPEQQELIVKIWERALRGEEFTIIGKIGISESPQNYYEVAYSSIRTADGELIGAAALARNVSERLTAERKIESMNKRLTLSVNQLEQKNLEMSLLNQLSSVLQSCNSVEETYSFIQKFARKILPYTAGVLYIFNKEQECLEFSCEWNAPKMQEKIFPAEHCFALRRGQPYVFSGIDTGIPCKHVEQAAVSLFDALCIPLITYNEPLGMLYLETIKEDENEVQLLTLDESKKLLCVLLAEEIALSVTNIKLRESLRQRSMRDSLTGLFNRNFLNEAVNIELHRAKRNNFPMAFVMLDLDNFKQINDTYGHDAGDLVLCSVGEVLLNNVRESDLVCRYGGEEFLILLLESDAKQAYTLVEYIREMVSQLQLNFSGQVLNKLTVSSGISVFPTHGDGSAGLIQKADKALYEAKHAGRNRTMIYSAGAEEADLG